MRFSSHFSFFIYRFNRMVNLHFIHSIKLLDSVEDGIDGARARGAVDV